MDSIFVDLTLRCCFVQYFGRWFDGNNAVAHWYIYSFPVSVLFSSIDLNRLNTYLSELYLNRRDTKEYLQVAFF